VPPASWTPTTIAAYAFAAALFLLGALAQAGVAVPAHVSTEVAIIGGVVAQVASAVTALLATLSHHSVVKVAIKARG